jgi:arabinoxylan arabinofuranohydrolase
MKQQLFQVISIVTILFAITSSKISAQNTSNLPKKDNSAYLFVYFTGNNIDEEAIRYAISRDGFNYLALNNNMPVIDSKVISSTGGIRDPHILRCQDGKTFYMVVTDMTSLKGWDSNRAMVLLKSTDLITWTSSVVNIQKRYPGNEDLKRVWAPQTIFDTKTEKYMIYWAMKNGDSPDKIYYAYANPDFTDLEGEAKQLFFPSNGKSCIDADIIQKDGIYHLFYKTEGDGNGIKQATSSDLTSGKWTEMTDYMQPTKEAVEGSCVFKLANSDTYILMYDVYMKGQYQFTQSTTLDNFKIVDNKISMNFHPRHGTIMIISEKELQTLIQKWGMPDGFQK